MSEYLDLNADGMRQALAERGFTFPANSQFMAARVKDNGHFELDMHNTTRRMMAMDAALTTTTAPNYSFPVQFYNFFDPEIIEIMFSAMNATELLNEKKEGSFTDDYITFTVEEGTGYVTPYSDFTNSGASKVNYTFPSRQTHRYSTMCEYGDLETEKAAQARISLASRYQQQAAMVMARAANKYYLYGVQGLNIYGILNDPNLNPPIAALAAQLSTGSKTKWEDKAADPDSGAMAIVNDIMAMWKELSTNNGSLISLGNTDVILAISNKMEPYLAVANKVLACSVIDILRKNFHDRIKIVSVPELSMAEGERLMLICSDVVGMGDAGFCAFTEKLRMKDVQRWNSSYRQQVVAATAGAIITRPNLIASMTGI